MHLIEQAVQDEVDDMDHRPDTTYPDMTAPIYPEIDWGNVRDRLEYLLLEHIDHPYYEDVEQVLEQVIEEAKGEEWVEVRLDDARMEQQEHARLQENPYKVYGVHKYDF